MRGSNVRSLVRRFEGFRSSFPRGSSIRKQVRCLFGSFRTNYNFTWYSHTCLHCERTRQVKLHAPSSHFCVQFVDVQRTTPQVWGAYISHHCSWRQLSFVAHFISHGPYSQSCSHGLLMLGHDILQFSSHVCLQVPAKGSSHWWASLLAISDVTNDSKSSRDKMKRNTWGWAMIFYTVNV